MKTCAPSSARPRAAALHPDPPNLAEIDGAVAELAVEFARACFPNDPDAVAADLARARGRRPCAYTFSFVCVCVYIYVNMHIHKNK